MINKMEPPPGIAPGWTAYRAGASLKMLWGRFQMRNEECRVRIGTYTSARSGAFCIPNSAFYIGVEWVCFSPLTTRREIGVPDRFRSSDLLDETQRGKFQAPNTKLQRSTKLQ